jgi:hypothetical protein
MPVRGADEAAPANPNLENIMKKNYTYSRLDRTRAGLLDRLKTSGHLLVNPFIIEEFSQMPVKDCRAAVKNAEAQLRTWFGRFR